MDAIKDPTGILFSAQLSQVMKFYLPHLENDLGDMGGRYDNTTSSFILKGPSDAEGFNTGRILFGGANERSKGNRGATGHLLGGDELGDWDEGFAESVFYPMGDVHDAYIILSGTPRGPNHFKDKYMEINKKMLSGDKDYYALKWTVEDSLREGEITQKQYDRWRKRYSGKLNHIWETEYMLDFDAPVPGRVFAPYIRKARKEKRVGIFGPEAGEPVEIFWDLGVNGTVCLFRQKIAGRNFYFKAIIQKQDVSFVEFLKTKVMKYIFESGLEVKKSIFPHDANWRDFESAKTRISIAREILGSKIDCEAWPAFKKMDEAVDKVCRTFHRCFFDEEGCEEFLIDLTMAQYEEGIFNKTGDFKQYTHSADAFILAENYGESNKGLSFMTDHGVDKMKLYGLDSKTLYEDWLKDFQIKA